MITVSTENTKKNQLLHKKYYNSDYLSIKGVNSPEQLLDWMSTNIKYELQQEEYSDDSDILTKNAQDVLRTKKGHCAEQSYLEKAVLDALGYETQLVFVKENSSQQDYGADGSAHVFLIYKDEQGNFCWFEHSMEHARGIHKYKNLPDLLQDVSDKWWRYDKDSDILEVRFLDNPITGLNNWQLAEACYDYPVAYIFDISNNRME